LAQQSDFININPINTRLVFALEGAREVAVSHFSSKSF